ncbi:MAG: BlaI/MecI/CopY family transcriptional regulator [Planctomycetota bacterium]
MSEPSSLSRRERQILGVVVRLKRATVGAVRDAMPDPPSYSAVRTTMGILVDKGHLRYTVEGRRYVYRPAQNPARLRRKALRDVVHNFFGDSAEQLVDALLDPTSRSLDEGELDRIAAIVERARKRPK